MVHIIFFIIYRVGGALGLKTDGLNVHCQEDDHFCAHKLGHANVLSHLYYLSAFLVQE